ncbi:MAG: S10 family peptidase [Opitutales bacterium]
MITCLPEQAGSVSGAVSRRIPHRWPLGLSAGEIFFRRLACLFGLVLLTTGGTVLAAPPDAPAGKDAAKEAPKEEGSGGKKAEPPVPKEESSVTHHQVMIGGQEIAYTATAGTLLIRKGDDPVASVFYVAYTRDGMKDPGQRPVTFFYNGGPGSSTIWLHMGSFGPRIIETANAQPTGPAPYHVVNNGDSLLDRSDLVFIDAVSTGFSRVVGKGEGKNFWGVDGDVEAFGNFITRYITLNHRWNSPKFLFGESYGTTRSAALVYHLQKQGMSFNGVVLLSTVLDFAELISPDLDEPLVNILPTYAAIAWFHDKLPHKPAELGAFLQQVRDFATGDYAQALARGHSLSAAQADAVAAKLHEFTGLSTAYLREANLRVSPDRFRKELLRDERRTVGRYDGRFEGIDIDAAGESPASDPSETSVSGAFTAALNGYLADELNFSHETPYHVFSADFSFRDWDWKHKLPDYRHFPIPYPMAYVVDDLGQAMRENPGLKVLSANGYFDLATPFFGTERDLYHMQLEPGLRDNLSFAYYPSGHMVYLNAEARKAFRADLAKFYDRAAKP